jgi:queuosine precursor transporter
MNNGAIFQSLNRSKQYKYPYILLSVYITFLLVTVCMANKLIMFGNIILPGGIFVFPLTFVICDILGEVYGYAYPRLFIWVGVLAEFIFSLSVIGVSHTLGPEYLKSPEAYHIVFDPTLRYVISGFIGLILGEFMNIYLLAKCKILLRGRFFIFRSLLSTAIGQVLLTIVVVILNYTGKMPSSDLISMMYSGYLFKIATALFMVFPSWILVKYLKKAENIDYYDVNTNFSPFALSLDNNINTNNEKPIQEVSTTNVA